MPPKRSAPQQALKLLLGVALVTLMVFITIKGASAVYEDAPPVALYRFTDGSLSDSYGIGDDFTNLGATNTTTNCNSDECYSFDGSNDYLYINDTDSNPLTRVGLSAPDFTVCVWNDKVGTGQKGILEMGIRNIAPYTALQFASNKLYAASGSGWSDAGAADRSLTFLCMRSVDGVGVTTSQDGAAFGSLQSITSTIPDTEWSQYIELGTFRVNTAAGDFWDGTIDDFMLFNYSLSDAQVAAVYANTSGNTDCPFTTCAPATSEVPFYPTALSPVDNHHTNNATVVFGYNVSLGTSTSVNCSFMLDGAVALTTTSITTNATLNFNHTGLNETSYEWAVQCYNGTSYNTTTNRTLFVDRTNVSENVNAGTFFTTDNTTTLNLLLDTSNVTINLTATDTYNFEANVTIMQDNCSGDILYTWQETNLTAVEYNITLHPNTSTWATGEICIQRTYSDDHTASTIPDWTYILTPQYVEYQPPSGNTIRIESVEGNLKGLTTEKLADRYTFALDLGNARNEHQISFHANQTIYYRGDLYEWPTFVTGEEWVDFVPVNMTMDDFEDVLVTSNAQGDYTINFKTVEKVDKLSFSSAGALNTIVYESTATIIRTPRQSENLTITAYNETWVHLTWDDHDEATSALLERNGTIIYNGTAGTYNDTGLTNWTLYEYVLRAQYNDSNNWRTNTSESSENNLEQQTSDHQNPGVNEYLFPTVNSSNITVGTIFPISINCTDDNTVNTVTLEVIDPNSDSTNYTTTKSGDIYTKVYTAGTPTGAYTVKAYCNDTAGNLNSTEVDYFVVTAAPEGGDTVIVTGGSGGGGGSDPAGFIITQPTNGLASAYCPTNGTAKDIHFKIRSTIDEKQTIHLTIPANCSIDATSVEIAGEAEASLVLTGCACPAETTSYLVNIQSEDIEKEFEVKLIPGFIGGFFSNPLTVLMMVGAVLLALLIIGVILTLR